MGISWWGDERGQQGIGSQSIAGPWQLVNFSLGDFHRQPLLPSSSPSSSNCITASRRHLTSKSHPYCGRKWSPAHGIAFLCGSLPLGTKANPSIVAISLQRQQAMQPAVVMGVSEPHHIISVVNRRQQAWESFAVLESPATNGRSILGS
jgi:hypothetical protein